jgi:putative tricarboxylic transport membrane protein
VTNAQMDESRTGIRAALRQKSELILAALVLGLGIYVIIGTADVTAASSAIGLGPRFFPLLVGGVLILVGVAYIIDVLRGGHGEAEESEDIDVSAPTDWRAFLLVGGIFLVFAVVVDHLGWIIAAALLFFGVARTLGAKSPVWNIVVSVVLSVGTYLIFVKQLGVTLPAGLLEGVL